MDCFAALAMTAWGGGRGDAKSCLRVWLPPSPAPEYPASERGRFPKPAAIPIFTPP
jgi:hypothetical protein